MPRMLPNFLCAGLFCCLSATTTNATEPGPACEAGKLSTTAKYASCRLKADSKAARTASAADYGKCDLVKFGSAEEKAGGLCPTSGDEASVATFVNACTDAVADALAGGSLPLDVATCNGDLADSIADLSSTNADLLDCLSLPVCGDGSVGVGEDCDDGNLNGASCVAEGFAGGTLSCDTGCVFDTSSCYAARFDASGLTIVDHQTGLEWEKKDSADGIDSLCPGGPTCSNAHDADNRYDLGTGAAADGAAYVQFLFALNAGRADFSNGAITSCYADHCDWRLPTIHELSGVPWPVAAFLPDAASAYWSATSYGFSPTSHAWVRGTLMGGIAAADLKTYGNYVRAVRTR